MSQPSMICFESCDDVDFVHLRVKLARSTLERAQVLGNALQLGGTISLDDNVPEILSWLCGAVDGGMLDAPAVWKRRLIPSTLKVSSSGLEGKSPAGTPAASSPCCSPARRPCHAFANHGTHALSCVTAVGCHKSATQHKGLLASRRAASACRRPASFTMMLLARHALRRLATTSYVLISRSTSSCRHLRNQTMKHHCSRNSLFMMVPFRCALQLCHQSMRKPLDFHS